MIDLVESKLVVPARHVRGHGDGLAQHVLIDRFHLVERHRIALRIEVVQIARAHNETGVADLAVVFRHPLHQLLGADHVFAEIDRRHPQAHDLGAQAVGNIYRIDLVAAATSTWPGPAHPASSRWSPPRGRAHARACPWRRAGKSETIRDTGRRLRGTDPPARACRLVAQAQPAWLEPDSNQTSMMSVSFRTLFRHTVAHLVPAGRMLGFRSCTMHPLRRGQTARPPCVLTAGSFSGLPQPSQRNTAMGTPQMRCREMHQSGRVAIMLRDALFAPCRIPFHFLDLFQRPAAQSAAARHGRFHGDEPLLGGAEDDRIVAAPAMRIRVLELFRMQQHAALLQQLDDRRVRLEHFLAVIFRQSVAHDAGCVHVAGRSSLYFTPVAKSSAPCEGAVWTTPVPVSMVT